LSGQLASLCKGHHGGDRLPLGLDGYDEDHYGCCWGLERVRSDGLVTADLVTVASAVEATSARSEYMTSDISGLIEANVRDLN